MSPRRSGEARALQLLFGALAVALLALPRAGRCADAPAAAPRTAGASGAQPVDPNQPVPFRGEHQAGIVTWPPQHHLFFATFDLVTTKREDVVRLLQAWTAAAARMSAGETAQPLEGGLHLAVPPVRSASPDDDLEDVPDPSTWAADSGEAIGMSPARLTITFGFGATLFVKEGKDRFGLASRRPRALIDMPKFEGDQMAEGRTGGDLAVQACAEDPQVAFHAVRQLARIAEGVAQLRWVQTGFRPSTGERHLLGFSNGKGNPPPSDAALMSEVVWGGEEGPAWMRGGTYLVARRIRFAIEHWDHVPVSFQEKAIGEMRLDPRASFKAAADPASPPRPAAAGEPAPPSHLDLVTPDALRILRRSFSYNDGVNFTAERWPPWRQGLEYDAGMFFICFQKDPRTGFVHMYEKMSKRDAMLNQFWTHEGGGLFAIPPGAREGEYVGQALFEAR
jgi:deferrochelatase/peroxidase EfeB